MCAGPTPASQVLLPCGLHTAYPVAGVTYRTSIRGLCAYWITAYLPTGMQACHIATPTHNLNPLLVLDVAVLPAGFEPAP